MGEFELIRRRFTRTPQRAPADDAHIALGVGDDCALLACRGRQAATDAPADLTKREREVLRLVIDGRPNTLIADVLQISVRTVEEHRARVFDKVNVKSAVELVNLMRDAGTAPGAAPGGRAGWRAGWRAGGGVDADGADHADGLPG